jgi:hypothetical protein
MARSHPLCESIIRFRIHIFALTRIIHIFEDNKSLLCYKHVI